MRHFAINPLICKPFFNTIQLTGSCRSVINLLSLNEDTIMTPTTYLNFADLLQSLAEIANPTKVFGYPPTDILKFSEHHYRIEMALAGYAEDDIKITLIPGGAKSNQHLPYGDRNMLVIEGTPKKPEVSSSEGDKAPEVIYVQRNIARRSFEQKLALDKHVEVGDVSLKNGLLTIDLNVVVP